MYRWHKELPLMINRQKQIPKSWLPLRRSELGFLRDLHPLRCPHSRLVGTGGCKAFKNEGNGWNRLRFRDLRQQIDSAEQLKEDEGIVSVEEAMNG